MLLAKITHSADGNAEHIEAVTMLFRKIDAAYSKTAHTYGFRCAGCRDNCCETLFYHHTLTEYIFLQSGFGDLPNAEKEDIRGRAAKVQAAMRPAGVQRIRLMCPLNRGGKCRLYAYRPMICRLHGIPHELILPGRRPASGQACSEFDERCGHKTYIPFDRTPFYREMVRIESSLRADRDFRVKIKMTVAQMILSWGPQGDGRQAPVENERGEP